MVEHLEEDRPLNTDHNAMAEAVKQCSVLEAVERYYRLDNANVHRGIHELSRRATLAYEGARERIARLGSGLTTTR